MTPKEALNQITSLFKVEINRPEALNVLENLVAKAEQNEIAIKEIQTAIWKAIRKGYIDTDNRNEIIKPLAILVQSLHGSDKK